MLRADAGAADSAAAFDDVRVVETRRSDLRGHDYFEDFENVDEGWGPFVYGYQGSTRTHLSEAHAPFTDDTIEGQFSLKTFDENNGLNFRTIPARLKFQPNTKYRLSFDYKTRNSEQYKVVMRSDDGGPAAEKLAQDLPGEPMQTQHFTAEFTTGAFGDYYLGIVKNAGDKWKGPKPGIKGAADTRAILVIDNLAVDADQVTAWRYLLRQLANIRTMALDFDAKARHPRQARFHGGGSSSAFLPYLILVSGLGGLLAGVDYGIIAGALLYLDKTIPMTAAQEGFMVSIYIFGGVIASLFAGTLADLLGRKKMMIMPAVHVRREHPAHLHLVGIRLAPVRPHPDGAFRRGDMRRGPALHGGMPARPRPGARHVGLPAPDDAWLCPGGLHRHAFRRCA